MLTAAGHDAITVLASLAAWGDAHRPLPDGPSVRYETSGGEAVRLAFVTESGAVVDGSDVVPRVNPAYAVRRPA